MERFSLEKWLQDKNRKVVTRSGHNVRILCTDQRGNMPIVALVEFETLDGVQIFYSDGKNESHREYDLFFEDEEELKPAWSEEDEKFLNYAISLTDDAQIKNFLKSLKDRVQPQPKQEWSEEDEKMLSFIDAILEYAYNNNSRGFGISCIDLKMWLKSLKDRTSQPHWKPTTEQMRRLKNAIGICKGVNEHTDAKYLQELFDQLVGLLEK